MTTPTDGSPERFDYSIPFQARMLKVLFQDPDFALSIAPHLDARCFDRPHHRFLAKTILDYAAKYTHGISQDALQVSTRRAFKSGRLQTKHKKPVNALLAKIDKPVKDRSFIREEVFRFVKNQTTKEAVLDAVDLLQQGDFEGIDVAFQRVIDVRMAAEGGLGHFIGNDNDTRLERRLRYVPDGVPTGIDVDLYMKPGGLPPKQLGAVVAPPSGGKTNSLIHIGKSAVLEGQVPVLHYTLELSEQIIVDRYDAAFTGTQINALEEGKNPQKIHRWWKRAMRDFGSEPVVVHECPMGQWSVNDLQAHTRLLERKGFYPGLIIVDYANLLKPTTGRTGDGYTDLGQIFVELREWARGIHVPLWTAMQGNRSSLGKLVITMKELADSFAPAMHADVLLALCQTKKEARRRRARYFIMKNRNGVGEIEIPVKLDWSRCTIRNMSEAA